MRRHGFMAQYLRRIAAMAEQKSRRGRGHRRAARTDVGGREGHRSRLPASAAPGVEAEDGPGARRWAIGLLAAAVMRARGLERTSSAARRKPVRRAQLAKKLGAKYHSAANKTTFDVKREIPPVDIAIEATGVSSVAFDAMQILGRNGVLCLLSVTGGTMTADSQPKRSISSSCLATRSCSAA